MRSTKRGSLVRAKIAPAMPHIKNDPFEEVSSIACNGRGWQFRGNDTPGDAWRLVKQFRTASSKASAAAVAERSALVFARHPHWHVSSSKSIPSKLDFLYADLLRGAAHYGLLQDRGSST